MDEYPQLVGRVLIDYAELALSAYFGIIALHLGIARTRHWWSTGRIGFNPDFVADVDAFIADRATTTYFDDLMSFDTRRLKAG